MGERRTEHAERAGVGIDQTAADGAPRGQRQIGRRGRGEITERRPDDTRPRRHRGTLA